MAQIHSIYFQAQVSLAGFFPVCLTVSLHLPFSTPFYARELA